MFGPPSLLSCYDNPNYRMHLPFGPPSLRQSLQTCTWNLNWSLWLPTFFPLGLFSHPGGMVGSAACMDGLHEPTDSPHAVPTRNSSRYGTHCAPSHALLWHRYQQEERPLNTIHLTELHGGEGLATQSVGIRPLCKGKHQEEVAGAQGPQNCLCAGPGPLPETDCEKDSLGG